MIGKTLGERYRLTGTLGSGAMGDVYLAEHVVLGKKMAVKVLKQAFCTNEAVMQRFQQEAIAASRIGHENIVSVTDFGRTDDGALYFVMEALEGESLGALVDRTGGQPLTRSLQLLMQVCRALTAAHAQGIVHRDLKLDNVMLVRRDDGTDLAKVLDFGISKVSAHNDGAINRHTTQAGQLLGTPDYMSPEQIRGEDVDHRADIYAFGVLAWELVLGTVPFVAKNAVDVMMKHLTVTPKAPSLVRPELRLPPSFDALVLRALEKDRERRFQTMTEVRAALVHCLEEVGVVPELTPPAGLVLSAKRAPKQTPVRDFDDTFTPQRAMEARATLGEKVAQGSKARGALLAVLGAGALAAGAAGGWWVLSRTPEPPVAPPVVTSPVPVLVSPVVAPPVPVVVPVAAADASVTAQPVPVVEAPVAIADASVPAPPLAHPVAPRPLPAHLGVKDMVRVFNQSQLSLSRCLNENKSLLPQGVGQLGLSFTVLPSGQVGEAMLTTPVDAKISMCLVGQVKKMRFPPHSGPPDSFDIPFKYANKP